MGNEEVEQNEIESIAEEIISKVPGLLSLEIYRNQEDNVHFAYQMEKTKNIPELISFLNSEEEAVDMEKFLSDKIRSSEFVYLGDKFVFTRVGAITPDYFTFLFVSKNVIGDCKRGLILIVDSSGVVFFTTCKHDSLNQFNLSLMSILYPGE